MKIKLATTLVVLTLAGCLPTTRPTSLPIPEATPQAQLAFAAGGVARVTSPDAPTADLKTVADGNNAFAFELYRAISDGENNLLFSPYSISLALAMVYAGAREETARQISDTLHFALPQERLHPALNALGLELASRSHTSVLDKSGQEVEEIAFQLNIANAVWGEKTLHYLPEYLEVLARNYEAGIRLVDFRQGSAEAAKAINNWISEKTAGRIPEIVGDLDPKRAGLVLVNAIYFNAKWDLPFDEAQTEEGPFHLLDGREEQVLMMHQRSRFRYAEGDGYQAIELPYLNREVAMVILLPSEGRFREIEKQLTCEWAQGRLRVSWMREVILTMPKFHFETDLDLKEALSSLGMPLAFSEDEADFFGIIEPGSADSIFINKVQHKAFMDVNEQRTEAAAATTIEVTVIVEGTNKPTPPPPVVMKIDRPFIFIIRDIRTGTILFVGRVFSPAEQKQ